MPLPSKYRWLLRIYALALGGYFLFWLIERFSGITVWDDAYFYVRYAENFLADGTYAWNAGEPSTWGLTSVLFGLPVTLFTAILPAESAPTVMFLSSFSFGMIFVWLMYRLMSPFWKNHPHTGIILCVVLLLLAMNAPHLAEHFGSGMDTTFAMAYMAGWLLLLRKCDSISGIKPAILMGIYAGMAYFVRPELPALTGLSLAGIWLFDKEKRNWALIAGISFVATICVECSLAYLWLGSVVPLPFFAKSGEAYGPEFSAMYSGKKLHYFLLFLLSNGLAALLAGVGWALARKKWWNSFSPGEKGLLGGTVVLMIYFGVFVMPIMGYHARLYYPLFPIFALISIKSINILFDNNPNLINPKTALTFITILIFLFPATAILHLTSHPPKDIRARLGNFSEEAVYAYHGKNVWPMLPALPPFPADFTIATTELGIPGFVLRTHNILDLSGLHNPQIWDSKGKIMPSLSTTQPDWVYLPHPDYQSMHLELHNSTAFQQSYEIFPAEALRDYIGVAILRESPYFAKMNRIIEAYIVKNTPGK